MPEGGPTGPGKPGCITRSNGLESLFWTGCGEAMAELLGQAPLSSGATLMPQVERATDFARLCAEARGTCTGSWELP